MILVNLQDWLNANKLVKNVNKTYNIIFSYKNYIQLGDVILGSSKIILVDKIKFLGLYIDEHLSFSCHISFIAGKISKSIGVLFKLNDFQPQAILKILYMSLIHPYLAYASKIYLNTFECHRNKLLTLQKKLLEQLIASPTEIIRRTILNVTIF